MAGSIVGTIRVPVGADISQAQSALQQLKKFAENIDMGSNIGRSMERAIEQVEKKLSKFEGKDFLRINSEGQLTKYNNDLQEIYTLLNNITQMTSQVTFKDLNTNKFTGELQTLQSELQKSLTAMESMSKVSFGKSIKESKEIQQAFSVLKEDLSTMDASKVSKTLTTGLQDLNRALEDAKKHYAELEAEQKKLESVSSPKAVVNQDKRTATMKSSVNSYLENIKVTPDAFQQLQNSFSTLINSDLFNGIDESIKNKLSEILKSGLEGIDTANLDSKSLKNIFDNIKAQMDTAIKANNNGKVPTGFFTALENSFKVDAANLQQTINTKTSELRAVLIDQINHMLPDMADTSRVQLVDDFLKQLSQGKSWDQAKEVFIKKFQEINVAAKTGATELQKNIEENRQKLNNAAQQVSELNSSIRTVSTGKEKYNTINTEFATKITNLQQQIDNLRQQIEAKGQTYLNNLKGNSGSNELVKLNQQQMEQLSAAAGKYSTELDHAKKQEKLLGNVGGIIQRWVGVYAAVRYVTKAYQNMKKTVADLDKTITNISIVTGISQDTLWGQMDSYAAKAQKFAASISGVYEVSQLYYQQGLNTAQVSALTDETLKLATVSGLGYTEATNYMTNAVRSFKMEMTDAAVVTDTYAALAASAATSVSEIAVAMSKTASSAQAVGMTLQDTASMITVMTEATREAPENIGSALKSIISRYGELKENPTALTDSEGQEMSFNKVDKALSSVGISMKDTNGQFRSFTDVIVELSGKWDTLDTNTQRYIATVMAGNRQQSRFLALVSSGERLTELMETANDSEGAGTEQFVASLDSIQAKSTQLQNTIQSMYLSDNIQSWYKIALDGLNALLSGFKQINDIKLPLIGGLPGMILKAASAFIAASHLITGGFDNMMQKITTKRMRIEDDSRATLDAEKAAKKGELTRGEAEKAGIKLEETIPKAESAPESAKPTTAKIEEAATDAAIETAATTSKATVDVHANPAPFKSEIEEAKATETGAPIEEKIEGDTSELDGKITEEKEKASTPIETPLQGENSDLNSDLEAARAKGTAPIETPLHGESSDLNSDLESARAKGATPIETPLHGDESELNSSIEAAKQEAATPIETPMTVTTDDSEIDKTQNKINALESDPIQLSFIAGDMGAEGVENTVELPVQATPDEASATAAGEALETAAQSAIDPVTIAAKAGTSDTQQTNNTDQTNQQNQPEPEQLSMFADMPNPMEGALVDDNPFTALIESATEAKEELNINLEDIAEKINETLSSDNLETNDLSETFSSATDGLEEYGDNLNTIAEDSGTVAAANTSIKESAEGAAEGVGAAGDAAAAAGTKEGTAASSGKKLSQAQREVGTTGKAASTEERSLGTSASVAGAGMDTASGGASRLKSALDKLKNSTTFLSVFSLIANTLQQFTNSAGGAIAVITALGAAITIAMIHGTLSVEMFKKAWNSSPLVVISAIIAAVQLLISGIKALIDAFDPGKKLEKLQEAADKTQEKATAAASEVKKNNKQAKSLQKLADARYDSEEALKAYNEEQAKIADELGDKIPDLISGYDEWGNALINIGKYYEYIAEKNEEATKAAAENADAQIAVIKEEQRQGKTSYTNANKRINNEIRKATNAGIDEKISQYQREGRVDMVDFYSKNADAQNIMSDLMTKQFKRSGKSSVNEWMNSAEYDRTFSEMEQKVAAFYTGLGDNITQLTELNNNKGQYTREQYLKKLEELGIDDQEIIDYYMEQFGNHTVNFSAAMKSKSRINANTSEKAKDFNSYVIRESAGFINELSDMEKGSVLSFYDKTTTLMNKGLISSETAENMADSYFNLWRIAIATEDEELQGILSNYDPIDASSASALRRDVNNLNRDWGTNESVVNESLDNLENLTPTNVVANMNAFFTTISEAFTNLSKKIKQLNDGLDFSEAFEIADNANMHISDFIFRDGKFYTDNLEAATYKDIHDIEEQTKTFQRQATAVRSLQNIALIDFRTLSGAVAADYINSHDNSLFNGNTRVLDWIDQANDLKTETQYSLTEYLLNEDEVWQNWNALEDVNAKRDSLVKLLGISADDAANLVDDITGYYTRWTNLDSDIRRTRYNNSFSEYLLEEATALEADVEVAESYLDYLYSSAYIGMGDTIKFLVNSRNESIRNKFSEMQISDPAKFSNIINHINSLDWNWLENSGELTPEEYEYITQYADQLYKQFHNINKTVYDNILSSMKDGEVSIEVTSQNRALLRQLGARSVTGDEIDDTTNLAIIDYANATQDQLNLLEEMIINDATMDESTKRSLLSQLHTNRYANTFYNRITKAITSFDNVTYEVLDGIALSLGKTVEELISEAGEAMIRMDPLTGNYKIDPGYLKQLIFSNLEDQTNKTYNSLIGKLSDAEYKVSDNKQWMDIVNNYTKLSNEMVGNLATLVGTSIDEFKELGLLTDNGNGTWSVQLAQLQAWISKKYDDAIPAAIQQQLNSAYDTVLKGISSATQLQTKGTTSWSDMWNTYNQIRQVFGNYSDINISSLYSWDEEIGSYTITSEGLRDQILLYQQQIAQSGKDINDAARHMFENNAVQLAKTIDIKSYLSNRNDDTWRKIEKAIDDYNQYVEAYNSTLAVPYWSMGADGKLSLPSRMVEEQNLPILKSINAEVLRGMLDVGGFAAIEALKQISDISKTDYSASDYKSAYLSGITNLTKTIGDQVNVSVGGVVDKATYDILNINNAISFDTTYAAQGIYVVTAINNLSEAYRNYMNEIINTAGRTAADINAAAARYLTYAEDWGGGEQSVIEAASSATSMTYEAFGTLLAEYGIQMTDATMEILREAGYVQALGGNKMAIIDFASFAQNILNISPDSPEYVSALKTYNDSLIAFNKKVSTNILSEFKNLENANIWDQLNFTEFFSALSQISSSMTHTIVNETDTGHFNVEEVEFDNVAEELNAQLHDFGAYIKDGILQITEDADILSITQTIAEYMQEYGNLTSAELAELADSIHTIVQNYVDMIKNGIAGSLTNANAQKLSAWAESRGLGQLDFTHTAEGLQLSVEAAKRLYFEMKKIDQFAAANLFEDLSERILSREGTNRYDVLNRKVDELIAKRNQLQAQPERSANNDRAIQELNEEIQLYQQLALAQMNVASNYSWMDNQLPEGLQGPVNYFNAAGTAFAAMKKGYEDGYLAPQDFFNMVTEFGNMAQTAGTDLTIAGYNFAADGSTTASLIEQGFSAIKYVEGQGMVIDLSGIGMSLEASADGLDQGMNEGIKAVAEAQVSVWEGIVSVLEVVAQIEALGDIDTDNDMHITLPEIIVTGANGENTGVYQQRIQEWRNQMLAILDSNDEATQATRDFLNNTKINGQALSSIIRKDARELTEQDAIAYDFIYQMAQHDWDINALPTEQLAAFQEAAERSGGAIEVDIGDVHYVITGTQVYSIDWGDDSDARRDVLEALNLSNEEATSLVAGYLSDPDNASTQQVEAYYSYRGIITLGSNGAPEIRFSDGNGGFVSINRLNNDGSENPLWANALEALKLTNLGYDRDKIVFDQQARTASVDVVIGSGTNGFHYNLVYDTTNSTYSTTNSHGQTFSGTPSQISDWQTQQLFLDWKDWQARLGNEIEGSSSDWRYNKDFLLHYGIDFTPTLNATSARNALGTSAWEQVRNLVQTYLAGGEGASAAEMELKNILVSFGFDVNEDTDMNTLLTQLGFETVEQTVQVHLDVDGETWIQNLIDGNGQERHIYFDVRGNSFLRTNLIGDEYNKDTIQGLYESTSENTYWESVGLGQWSEVNGARTWAWNSEVMTDDAVDWQKVVQHIQSQENPINGVFPYFEIATDEQGNYFLRSGSDNEAANSLTSAAGKVDTAAGHINDAAVSMSDATTALTNALSRDQNLTLIRNAFPSVAAADNFIKRMTGKEIEQLTATNVKDLAGSVELTRQLLGENYSADTFEHDYDVINEILNDDIFYTNAEDGSRVLNETLLLDYISTLSRNEEGLVDSFQTDKDLVTKWITDEEKNSVYTSFSDQTREARAREQYATEHGITQDITDGENIISVRDQLHYVHSMLDLDENNKHNPYYQFLTAPEGRTVDSLSYQELKAQQEQLDTITAFYHGTNATIDMLTEGEVGTYATDSAILTRFGENGATWADLTQDLDTAGIQWIRDSYQNFDQEHHTFDDYKTAYKNIAETGYITPEALAVWSPEAVLSYNADLEAAASYGITDEDILKDNSKLRGRIAATDALRENIVKAGIQLPETVTEEWLTSQQNIIAEFYNKDISALTTADYEDYATQMGYFDRIANLPENFARTQDLATFLNAHQEITDYETLSGILSTITGVNSRDALIEKGFGEQWLKDNWDTATLQGRWQFLETLSQAQSMFPAVDAATAYNLYQGRLRTNLPDEAVAAREIAEGVNMTWTLGPGVALGTDTNLVYQKVPGYQAKDISHYVQYNRETGTYSLSEEMLRLAGLSPSASQAEILGYLMQQTWFAPYNQEVQGQPGLWGSAQYNAVQWRDGRLISPFFIPGGRGVWSQDYYLGYSSDGWVPGGGYYDSAALQSELGLHATFGNRGDIWYAPQGMKGTTIEWTRLLDNPFIASVVQAVDERKTHSGQKWGETTSDSPRTATYEDVALIPGYSQLKNALATGSVPMIANALAYIGATPTKDSLVWQALMADNELNLSEDAYERLIAPYINQAPQTNFERSVITIDDATIASIQAADVDNLDTANPIQLDSDIMNAAGYSTLEYIVGSYARGEGIYNAADVLGAIQSFKDIHPEITIDSGTLLQGILTSENLSLDTTNAQEALSRLQGYINNLAGNHTISCTVTVRFTEAEGSGDGAIVGGQNQSFELGNGNSKGNIALSKGNRTLMGELGPELVVSGGKYFVVGQNGAEFVNLDKDAIVFNHLQTKRLLNTGHGGHGKPITNEREATSFAKGNASGQAMASASAALNSARQILAAWKSLANLGLSDLAQKAGGGGGGGGDKKNNAAYLADLERWYNLLREVDRLEKSITYQETLRSKLEKDRVIDGKAYYESQKESIKLLEDEIAKKHELVILQKQYYDARRQDLEASPFGQFMRFDDHGHLQFTEGYEKLVDMNATNADGSTKYTAEEQYNMLKEWGFENYMKYDSSGKEIDMSKKDDGYTNAVKAFWDKFEGWKEELDDLYDGFTDYQNDVLSLEGKYNELLQKIIDNQISLENRIEKAIEDARQREIDEAKSQKDAIQKSSQDFIQGLSDSLDKERKMYEDSQSQNELNRMRRQLAILQRSGGSASQIRSLQQDIASREQDEYFNEQQNQIDAIQKASEAEIKKMEQQISIMEETLKYEKEHGLLWDQVYEVMNSTPEEIESFLLENSKDLEGKSTLQIAEDLRTIKSEIEQWIGYRDDENNPIASEGAHNWNSYYTAAQSAYSLDEKNDATIINAAKAAYDETYERTGDENAAARAADEIFYKQFGDRPGAHAVAENTGYGTPSSGSNGGGGGRGSGNSNDKNVSVRFIHLNKATGGILAPPTKQDLEKNKKYRKSIGKITINGFTLDSSMNTTEFTATEGLEVKIMYNRNNTTTTSDNQDSNRPVRGFTVIGTDASGSTHTENYPITQFKTPELARHAFINKYHGSVNRVVKYYKKGGLADYTGLAMVHGSPQDPEAFLNAEETHMWRDKILSGNSGSLTSMLIDFQDMVSGMVNSDSYSEIGVSGSGVNIENAVVNMNATISNDYDARRAADTVMNEMIRIARKTTAQQARR